MALGAKYEYYLFGLDLPTKMGSEMLNPFQSTSINGWILLKETYSELYIYIYSEDRMWSLSMSLASNGENPYHYFNCWFVKNIQKM